MIINFIFTSYNELSEWQKYNEVDVKIEIINLKQRTEN